MSRSLVLGALTVAGVTAAASPARAQGDEASSTRQVPATSPSYPAAPLALPPLPAASTATSPSSTASSASELVPDAPPPTERHWYGWETLLVDAGALTTMIAGAVAQSTAVGVTGVTAYALGPSVVHAARGRGEAALVDASVRVLLPVFSATVGYAIDVGTSPPCAPDEILCLRGLGGLAAGLVVGYVGAVIIDASVLAWDRVPLSPDRAPAAEQPASAARIRWAPTVGITQQGATAGVVGAF
ncbi:MAG TPA: hypothetical protein VIY73_00195 [Polyangiaceae bacterium]